jgi:TonB family protein
MSRDSAHVSEFLGPYVDRELDSAKAEQVRLHLETCADCRRELAQIEELNKLVKAVQHPVLAEDFWDWHRIRIWRRIREGTRQRMPEYKPSFALARLASVAAGVAVVLVVVIAGWRMFGERSLVTGKGAKVSAGAQARSQVAETVQSVTAEKVPAAAARGSAIERKRDLNEQELEVAGQGGAAAAEARAGVRQGGKDQDEAVVSTGKKMVRDGGWLGSVSEEAKGKPARTAAKAVVRRELASPAPPEAGLPVGRAATDSCASIPELIDGPMIPSMAPPETGTAVIRISLDTNGLVVRALVSQTSGFALLDTIALRSARASRFRPAAKDNRLIPCSFERPYRFKPAAKSDQ